MSDTSARLGKGAHFEGRLTFEGTAHIEGRFTGEIKSNGTLVLGEGAQVKADLQVGQLVSHGDIIGDVTASESVALHSPSRLKGHITTPALVMDQGVLFDGNVTMTPRGGGGEQAAAAESFEGW